jgi:hypothetical protein
MTEKAPTHTEPRGRGSRTVYILFALMGVGLAVQQVSFQAQQNDDDARDIKQNTCLITQVTEITAAFEARASLNARDSDTTKRVFEGLKDGLAKQDLVAVQKSINSYIADQEAIAADRKANPVPPFPDGKCEGV